MREAKEAGQEFAGYASLESEICDLRNMADIASSHIERSMSGLQKRITIGDQKIVGISEREADLIMFSIYQVDKMARELLAKYYEIWEGLK
jgi:phosphate uptake regulator